MFINILSKKIENGNCFIILERKKCKTILEIKIIHRQITTKK